MILGEKLAIIELISKTEDQLHEYESKLDLGHTYIDKGVELIERKKERIKMYIELLKENTK